MIDSILLVLAGLIVFGIPIGLAIFLSRGETKPLEVDVDLNLQMRYNPYDGEWHPVLVDSLGTTRLHQF